MSKLLLFILFIAFSLCAIDDLLFIRPDEPIFQSAVTKISNQLEGEFSYKELLLNKNLSVIELAETIKSSKPKMIILFDNRSINLYKQYQKLMPDSTHHIPTLVLFSVFIEEQIKWLKNTAGIIYEVPLITSIRNLQSIQEEPINKIGVIHRNFLRKPVQQNREFCKTGNIEVIAHILSNKSVDYWFGVKKGLTQLLKKDKVDALWIPNDMTLMTPKIVQQLWIPMIKKYKKPVIVGVEALVDPKLNLGTFAVLPDHSGICIQAADMIFTIADNNWKIVNRKIQPLSVFKIINLRQAKKFITVKESGLENVDKVLK